MRCAASSATCSLQPAARDAVSLEPGGGIPAPDSAKFRALVAGELDGIFDEGAGEWLGAALEAGMQVLALDEAALTGSKRWGTGAGGSNVRVSRNSCAMSTRSTSAAADHVRAR